MLLNLYRDVLVIKKKYIKGKCEYKAGLRDLCTKYHWTLKHNFQSQFQLFATSSDTFFPESQKSHPLETWQIISANAMSSCYPPDKKNNCLSFLVEGNWNVQGLGKVIIKQPLSIYNLINAFPTNGKRFS